MSYTVKAQWQEVHESNFESLDEAVRQARELMAYKELPYVYIEGEGTLVSFTTLEPATNETV